MLRDEIHRALEESGIAVTDAGLLLLARHAEMLIDTNRTLNLTRITSERDVARLHVADSLAALPEVEAAPPGHIVDLGSGGGFPGIPLAIVSGRPLTLIESTRKKAAFLSEVVAQLGVDGEVLAERAEEAAEHRRNAFSAVTARAVAPLAALVELAAPFLVDGGRFVALKGDPAEEEIAAGDRAALVVGLRRTQTRAFALPADGERRTIVTYTRVGKPRVRLPRRPGSAQHSPLG